MSTEEKQQFDEYEKYEFEHDKHMFSGHSGKQRTKTEAAKHTNHNDPCGHSRKILTKLQNTENNKKKENAPAAKN
ncbi:CLUMA_CG017170, isoform A [Clunio marinus]|uniref:CLUMA_CG017170, isoform A n=1 Tax=Clunio marinus TaxID=568069 RepID=A0A1J1IZQ0_9DIPT|nr:CLUMA_CG017170, isoform A [Clunio marinus]